MSLFNKLFGKKELSSAPLPRVLEEKWYTDKDYGATRMQRREDGSVDFVWLEEENEPVGTRFSSMERAKNFLKDLRPADFREDWSYSENEIMWTESVPWEE